MNRDREYFIKEFLEGSGKESLTNDDLVRIDFMLDGNCESPGCREPGVIYHQRTAYRHSLSNWVSLCSACRQENDSYWDERWADYYNGLL